MKGLHLAGNLCWRVRGLKFGSLYSGELYSGFYSYLTANTVYEFHFITMGYFYIYFSVQPFLVLTFKQGFSFMQGITPFTRLFYLSRPNHFGFTSAFP